MEVRVVHDADLVYWFLKDRVRYNYIYQFSNLETDQWNQVICYGLFHGEELKEIAMISMNYGIPVLLAAGFDNEKYSTQLLRKIKKFLPPKFYAHMDKSTVEEVFAGDKINKLEEYMNMGLEDFYMLNKEQYNDAIRIGFNNIREIKRLLSAGNPEAWLDEDLVKLNENFGLYLDGNLISFAGIHAFSRQNDVAAIAHVTTHPDYRNRGFGRQVVAGLANSLKGKIRFIGLNVKTDNLAAIKCYENLGFEEFGRFVACEVEVKTE